MIGALLTALRRKGILLDADMENLVKILYWAGYFRMPTVSRMARIMGVSRRTLSRRFEDVGLPPPKAWLQLGRVMGALNRMNLGHTMEAAADYMRYPDPFTLSNQMVRVLGLRPSTAKGMSTHQIIENWIEKQKERGQLIAA